MARLRITCGDGIEQTVELREQTLRIGRGRDNDLVLPDPQKGVSRLHAELRYENGRYVVVDLQSQNGTWVNGRRVERAEVPPGAEIALGEYRLTLQDGPPSAQAAAGAGLRETRPVSPEDLQIRQSPGPSEPASARRPASGMPKWIIAAIAVIAIVAVAAVVRTLRTPAPVTSPSEPVTPAPAATGDQAAREAPAPSSPDSAPTRTQEDRPDERAVLNLPMRSPIARPVAGAGTPAARVARKPGETSDAWRSRAAALYTRYEYSKAAMDRGDFAAAAGGFEAILLEEPGYLDAPTLLVQARSALRATARSLFQAGTKLDEAGDWVGALQKYEQARQIYAGVPGLSDRLHRVRERLNVAGASAFRNAQQHEANGRVQDALREYEKAAQWLPPDDPNRQIARSKVEQLKRN